MDDAFSQYFNSHTKKTALANTVFRIVESDLHIATLKITDSLTDQMRLEALIDNIKPKTNHTNKHYLLTTPFRYPPLKHGSRMGDQAMGSFFYGSLKPETCLVECAYYRFLFLSDLSVPFDEPLNNNFLLFSASVASLKALDLTSSHYEPISEQLVNRKDYSFTQKIGRWAVVERDFNLIKFNSARHQGGINFAIATLKCIKSRKPKIHSRLACVSTDQKVIFEYQGQLINIPKTVMQEAVGL
ncbi:hypothetical protein MNBD_GAMMA02-1682 [hydrothermal vent metagenome]|uniref:RES domain-containing protein n=1 Tax=hydrothermal vent metagenome TaxID=652676 RepID=A0A3B0WB38_9ZZZZ